MTTHDSNTLPARIAVKEETRRKIALLAAVLDEKIYDIVDYWADVEWKRAEKCGLVNDAMLEPKGAES